jgi:2-polyprenyl-3-methyl-5-hydroxy-6-metoxy-1,4-benzoquinol methylase
LSLWTVAPSRQAELMDDPSLATADHLHALSALARINAFSGTAGQLAAAIQRLTADSRPPDRPLEVVDIACGGGDVTMALARRLARLTKKRGRAVPKKLDTCVTGIDVSPRAVDHATAKAAQAPITPGAEVAFAVRDVVADGCPDCDVAVSSLFLHHLDDPDALRVLEALAAAARIGVVVSDLLRSRAGLVLAMVGTTVLSRSRVARVDGPLSVRAARTLSEYRDLFDRAGLHGAVIRRAWPERAVITWRREPPGANA